MSKVQIVTFRTKNYSQKPIIMTWAEYQAYCCKVPGEGDTWKAVLI